MTTDRANSCPAFLAKFSLRRDPWNKSWWRKLMMQHYRSSRLARIMAVERRRVLPDLLWHEKQRLLEQVQ